MNPKGRVAHRGDDTREIDVFGHGPNKKHATEVTPIQDERIRGREEDVKSTRGDCKHNVEERRKGHRAEEVDTLGTGRIGSDGHRKATPEEGRRLMLTPKRM